MVALTVQTLLLMAAAYFIGAALACLIRRSLFASTAYRPVERRVDPLPEVARRDAIGFGRETSPSSPLAPPLPPARPVASPPAASDGAQDLKRIRLIDGATEASLNKLGVTRYEHIAGWMRDDVKKVSQALGIKGRINQENWIEQALILAKGGETYYSARRARGEAATAAPTSNESDLASNDGATLPLPMSRGGVAAAVVAPPLPGTKPAPAAAAAPAPSPPLVSERAAFAGGTSVRQQRPASDAVDAVQAVPVRPMAPAHDNLQRIGTITREIEKDLNTQGISRYAQIAQWSQSEIDTLEKHLRTGGRIARENWVEQAQILSRGGDTRFSREFDGATPEQAQIKATRTDLGSLRSVRSRAYQGAPEPGPEAAQRAGAQNRVLRGAISNDLKRIRGIGVLIEKKLNSMGVVTYEHIANWTADDIDRVSQSLDFKGRIELENWVEQARILIAGGQTEFSRRVDRGEVETSRVKT